MDPVSAQIDQEIRDAVTCTLAERQPLLHKLNADTSYLLQLPRPLAASKRSGRVYYNVLIDPWLSGAQSKGASWFAQQWHAVESAVRSIGGVEELAREIEILAGGLRLEHGRVWNGLHGDSEIKTFLDLVIVSHEFTDHCHRETLLEIDPDVPVFAPEQAAALIRAWDHFRTVHTIETFPLTSCSKDWQSFSLPPLPEWLAVMKLRTEDDAFDYHSAIFITFSPPCLNAGLTNGAFDIDSQAAVIVYTPHGIPAQTVASLSQVPMFKVLALLHGLHEVRIGAQRLHLGAHNGFEVQRALGAKYWIATHDGIKRGALLSSWFITRKVLTFADAINEYTGSADEFRGHGASWSDSKLVNDMVKREQDALHDTSSFLELRNGESLVLR